MAGETESEKYGLPEEKGNWHFSTMFVWSYGTFEREVWRQKKVSWQSLTWC